jgi:hypothetical protein
MEKDSLLTSILSSRGERRKKNASNAAAARANASPLLLAKRRGVGEEFIRF